MKMTKMLASVAVMAMLGTSAARADYKGFWYRCSPGALRACASLEMVTTLNISGGTDVIIRVRNLQGYGPSWIGDNTGGSLITRLGIVAPPITGTSVTNGALSVTAVGGASAVNNPAPLWFLRDPGSLGAPIELTANIGVGTRAGGIAGCSNPFGAMPARHFRTCDTGSGAGWIEFKFSTSNAWSANSAEVAWLDQGIANGNATIECGSSYSGPNGQPRDWCTGVTPEPVTMVLLGSGLAGMSGFGFFRRRKNTEIENS